MIDLESVKLRVAGILDHIESISRKRSTMRDLWSVGEIKVCMEFVCDTVADEELNISQKCRTDISVCCKGLGVDERFLLD